MGDKRLAVDESTKIKLQESLDKQGIKTPIEELSNSITRSQAGRMIQLVNQVRTDHGKEKITRNIQGLLDKGAFEDLGRDKDTPGNQSFKGNDRGDEGIFERIKAWAVRRTGQVQIELNASPFLTKDEMAQIHWPPFPREEQDQLKKRFNADGAERVRFADKEEAVQGRYVGSFNYQGVEVGAIQEGRGGDSLINLVPFTDQLSKQTNQNVRYDIGQDKVSNRLQEQLKMVMTDQGTGESFSKVVTVETGGKESIEEQKKSFVDDMQKQLRLSSSKYDISFEKLQREQIRQLQLEQSLSQGPKI